MKITKTYTLDSGKAYNNLGDAISHLESHYNYQKEELAKILCNTSFESMSHILDVEHIQKMLVKMVETKLELDEADKLLANLAQ
jgi:hypothetical protein